MANIALSKAVTEILNWIRENEGDIEFSENDAKLIFNGSKVIKVKDLTERQMLQYALLLYVKQGEDLLSFIEEKNKSRTPNREQRRREEKNKK